MPGAPTPPILLKAIAALAAAGSLPGDRTDPMPESSTGTNAASVETGFPSITMQNELAGGKPPLGQDMNGLFFLVSSHTLYVECGQTYKYNSTLAAAISGYLAGTILGMTDDTGIWLCIADGTTSDPDAGGAGWVPLAAYGKTTVTGLTGGTVTLTPAQTKYGVIILQGVLTGNLSVNFPQTMQEWLVINSTSGAFSTTVKTAAVGSAGVIVPQGGFGAPTGVYSIGDGNIYPTVAPLNLPIDQNPNPLTIVQRTNAGYVLATYFNQNSPNTENPPVGAIFVQHTNNDGFLRKAGVTFFESQLLLQGIGGAVTNGQVPYSVVQQWAAALFSSPNLTGTPIATTPPIGDSSARIATTAFVNPASDLTNGWTTESNGFKIQSGTAFINGATRVNFNSPFNTRCIAVVFTNINSTNQIYQTAKDKNGFNAANGTANVDWIAVGY